MRALLKAKCRDLPPHRRKEAAHQLFHVFLKKFHSFPVVLSFMSLPLEINTSQLNQSLQKEGRLLLPKVIENHLEIFRVTDMKTQLEPQAYGIYEPIPSKCEKVMIEEIELVLVPALGFDRSLNRIGYGKGFYDRFLASIPNCYPVGIGFKDQLVHSLPLDPTDFPLKAISLF